MKNIQPGGSRCEEIRQHLDAYVSNESAPEASRRVLQHLENCPACAAELEVRNQMRGRLKAAVERQYVPRELRSRVRDRIGDRGSRAWWRAGWNRWAVAATASLAVAVGILLNHSSVPMPALSDRPGQDAYIQRVSASLTPVLKGGLGDHIHCSIFRKYPKNPPSVTQMVEDLGPPYKDLLELTKTAVSDRYRVIMAHQCGYAGRKYIHLTLESKGELVSLVIARKNAGESMTGLAPATSISGIPVYQAAAQRYEVAAFDAGQYLAFIVSELPGKTNLQIAANIAAPVHEFLTRLPA
jgi:anti-sigma factor (TIGR02949 family)